MDGLLPLGLGLMTVFFGGGLGGGHNDQPPDAPRATLSRGLQAALDADFDSDFADLTDTCAGYRITSQSTAPDEKRPDRAGPESDDHMTPVSEIIVSFDAPPHSAMFARATRRIENLGFTAVRSHPQDFFIVYRKLESPADEIAVITLRQLVSIDGVSHIEENCPYPLPTLPQAIGNLPPDEDTDHLCVPGNGPCEPDADCELPDPIKSWLPNDRLFLERKSWGLESISVFAPWSEGLTRVSDDVLVVVIDSGVDYEHDDLEENMWKNDEESADDFHGAVFIRDNCESESPGPCVRDPMDVNGHGTFVASIIGSRGDNQIGMVGVAWNIKMVPVRIGKVADFEKPDLALAIDYAADLGRRLDKKIIVNASVSIDTDESKAVLDAIKRASEVLIVAAAGNADADYSTTPVYPAAFDAANIVSVSSTAKHACREPNVHRSGHAFDPDGVDIHAPGISICGISIPSCYSLNDGTTNSAPYFAGAAALVWSHEGYAELGAVEIKELLMARGRMSVNLQGKSKSGKTLDLGFLDATE